MFDGSAEENSEHLRFNFDKEHQDSKEKDENVDQTTPRMSEPPDEKAQEGAEDHAKSTFTD